MRYILGGLIIGAVIGLFVAVAQVTMWVLGGVLRLLWSLVAALGELAWEGIQTAWERRAAANRTYSVAEISQAVDAEWEKHVTV